MTQKNYIGRTNRNGTKVTRATFDRLSPEWLAHTRQKRVARAKRWDRANQEFDGYGYYADFDGAPRHIREIPWDRRTA